MIVKTNLIKTIFILAIIAFTFNSCKKENEDGTNELIRVPETTKIIKNEVWQSNFTGIDSSNFTLFFDKNLSNEILLEPGDFIISTDGFGLLRKIYRITENADGLKIETKFASLTDVVNEGQTSFNSVLSTQKIMKINYLKKGVVIDTSLMKSTDDTQLEYSIDVFLDPEDKIHLQGDFSILTELNGQLEIGQIPPRINLFEITYGIDQSLDLSAEIELANLKYKHEVDLVNVYFQPIVALISGVPLVLVPQLEIAVGVDSEVFCDVYTEIKQEMDYNIGLKYENKEWTPYNDFNKSFNYTPPILNCNAEAKAYIKPQFNILIYGVLSPYLYGDIYGKINSNLQNNPWWSVYTGADLGIGVEAEILGKEIFDFYTNPPLISYEQLIASAPTSVSPTAEFTSNTINGPSPLQVSFSDQSFNNPTSWEWDFGDGANSLQASPSHTYNTEGSYTVTLTVTNSNGSDTESKLNYITVSPSDSNTPPTPMFIVSPTTGTTNTIFAFDASGSTDNEDPTSDLNIRWDFDGDGSWDTNWDTDKTQNHQYISEATYFAKMEIKDTEGLTNQYTKSIVVNNGESDNLVAYFPFNGNANDESGNNLNGTVTNASLTYDRHNLPNKAYNFDGDEDFISVENSTLLQAANSKSFSWSFWISPSSKNHVIMFKGKNGSSGAYFDWWIDYTNEGKIRFRYSTSNITAQSHYETFETIPLDLWTFLTITYEFGQSSTMKIFINGSLVNGDWVLGTGNHAPYTSVEKLYVGKHNLYMGNYNTYDFFDGDIDDIRIFNSLLSETEILNLFNEGK